MLHFEWICWGKLSCMVLHGFHVPALFSLCFPRFYMGLTAACGLTCRLVFPLHS
jgi:hypothetical protein